jgi:hypothetical protein
MPARVPISKPASICAARARRTSLRKRRASSRTSAKSRAAARSNSASSFAPGEFLRSQRRPGSRSRCREVRWRIHGEIGHYFGCAAPDDEPAECVAVVDALGGPAPFPCRGFQRVACRGHVAAVRGGEEIQVFRRPCREMLREQGRSPGQQKRLARGRLKNSLVTSSWKSVRSGMPASRGSLPGIYAALPRDAWITGAHADRTARGSTRSSHRSTSSAPST